MAAIAEMVGPSAAARTLGISTSRVRQLLAEGRLTGERSSLGRLIDPDSLERFRVEREARRAPDPLPAA